MTPGRIQLSYGSGTLWTGQRDQGGIHVASAPEVELQGFALAPAAPAVGFHPIPLRQHIKRYFQSLVDGKKIILIT